MQFRPRRHAGEFERVALSSRNSSGALSVQSSRSLRSRAPMSAAVAERRREHGRCRSDRSATIRRTSARPSGRTAARVRSKFGVPTGVNGPNRCAKVERNRSSRFHLARKKRSSTLNQRRPAIGGAPAIDENWGIWKKIVLQLEPRN